MGKKKKILLQYKRFGKISKKLKKKFSSFLLANSPEAPEAKIDPTTEAKEEVQETAPVIEEAQEVEKPEKTTRKRTTSTTKKTTTKKPATKKTTTKKATTKKTPAKKTATTTRKRRTTKAKAETSDI